MKIQFQTLCLVLALATFTAQAKLEIRSKFQTSDHHNVASEPRTLNVTDDAKCNTPLRVNESFGNVVDDNTTTGYLNVNPDTSSALFFLYYKCRSLNSTLNPKSDPNENKTPLVVWLQGGPGGSSLTGAFIEFGPYSVLNDTETNKTRLLRRDLSWNDYYNLLFIEQPVGVGFGKLDPRDVTNNETEVGKHFVQAMVNFYYTLNEFKDFSETPLYITGESYAGHYIPAIASAIIKHNEANPSQKIPLKGVAIGDGWTDPANQLSEFGLYAYSLGLIDDDQRAEVEGLQVDAVYNIAKGREHLAKKEFKEAEPYMGAALDDFGSMTDLITKSAGGVNVYNYRIFGDYTIDDNMTNYLNTPEVQQAYCIRGNTTWRSGSAVVNAALSAYDFMDTVTPALVHTLSSIPVLLYNGQDDIICNSPSSQTWISELEWSGQQEFYDAVPQVWVLNNGTHAGMAKSYDNLTFVVVNQAGHLVPMDQMEPSLEMLRRFTEGKKEWNNNTQTAEKLSKKFNEAEIIKVEL